MGTSGDKRIFAVIGGGIVGLCVARRLARTGERVVLAERTRLGAGASGAAAGILEPPWDPRSAFQKQLWASYRGYQRFVDELSAEVGIAIEFRKLGSLHLAADEKSLRSLRRRYEKLRPGSRPLRWLGPNALRTEVPGIADDLLGGLVYEDAAWVHTPDLIRAMRMSLDGLSVAVREGSRVEFARPSALGGDFELLLVSAEGNEERLGGVRPIVCAGAWTEEIMNQLGIRSQVPFVPIRGQMVELAADGTFPFVIHYEDRYLIPRSEDLLWVGATVEEVGYDNRVTAEGRTSLIDTACRVFPALRRGTVLRSWSGLRPKVMRRGGALMTVGDVTVLAGHYRSGILAAPRDADRLVAALLGKELEAISPFEEVL